MRSARYVAPLCVEMLAPKAYGRTPASVRAKRSQGGSLENWWGMNPSLFLLVLCPHGHRQKCSAAPEFDGVSDWFEFVPGAERIGRGHQARATTHVHTHGQCFFQFLTGAAQATQGFDVKGDAAAAVLADANGQCNQFLVLGADGALRHGRLSHLAETQHGVALGLAKRAQFVVDAIHQVFGVERAHLLFLLLKN